MALAAKFASQPPISAAMTKLTINRLTHALGDLTSHIDIDQFALANSDRRSLGGRGGASGAAQAAFQETLRPGRLARGNPDPHIHCRRQLGKSRIAPVRNVTRLGVA
jgi:hypothetical protein